MTIRSGEAYGTMFGDSQSSDGRPDPRRGIPPLDLGPLDPKALEEARIRQEGKTNYTFEYPDKGSKQYDTWDLMTKNGLIDPTAVPGSAKNPIFEMAGRDPPPSGAAWVGLDGAFHEPYGAYTTVQPEDLPPQPKEVPVTFGGTAKAALSGLADTVYGLAAQVNPNNLHGLANGMQAGTGLAALLMRDAGAISDDQMNNVILAEQNLRHRSFGEMADTTNEQLRAWHLYKDPENATEQFAQDVASQVPYAFVPEAGELGVAQKTVRMAERSAMRELGREGAYNAGRTATRVARTVAPLAAPVVGRETARILGRDKADQDAMASLFASGALHRFELGARPPRFGDKWDLKALTPDQIYEVSTAKMPPEAIPSAIAATRQANALSYFTDGMTVRNTKGQLRTEASSWNETEKRRAAASGKPYRYQVGHSPDAALSGKPYSVMDPIDQHPMSNAVIGGGLGPRIGDHIKLFTLDGVPHGLPSRSHGMAYYGLMGGQLVNSASQDHDR